MTQKMLSSTKEQAFIYKLDNEYIGFINLSIRTDYVEGSNSSPVLRRRNNVKPEYRNRELQKLIIKEEWAKSKDVHK